MLVLRPILCVLLAFTLAALLKVDGTGLLEGVCIQALSIISAAAITAAFFFLQGLEETAERTVEHLNLLRVELGLVPLSTHGKEHIRSEFERAGDATHKNAVAILVLVSVFVIAIVLDHSDIPGVSWPKWTPFSKLQSVHGVAFSAFGLIMLATYDIMATAYDAHKLRRRYREKVAKTCDDIPSRMP